MLTQDGVKNALREIKYPGYSRDIVSFGLVKNISIQGDAVNISLGLTSGNAEVAAHTPAAVVVNCRRVMNCIKVTSIPA